MRAPDAAADTPDVNVAINFVAPGWFAAYRTGLPLGRDFTAQDAAGGTPVVIVNRAFARRFLGTESPIGRAIPTGQTIVGVSEDAIFRSSQRVPGVNSLALREPASPAIYAPLAQYVAWNRPPATRIRLSLRTSITPPVAVMPAVAAAIASVDPAFETTFRPLADDINASLSQERMNAGIAGAFGGLSVCLVTLGLYGVTSYSVSRRRSEIGIRMAVGAGRGDVIRLVVVGAMRLVVAGLALGIAVAFLLTRALSGMLFEVAALDPASFVVLPAMIAAIAGLAALVPARRASHVDPVPLLRGG
jgi:hypothetical protein